MKQLLFFWFCAAGLILFNSSSCERCEEIEPSIFVRFVDSFSGQQMLPRFESVREITMDTDLNFNPNRRLYLNLNSDSVTYIFTKYINDSTENEIDTISISYLRDLDYLNGSYCMRISNENLTQSTFSSEASFDKTEYEITIYN